jgi:predicted DNA-binding ribbon-helix-helix protein
MPEPKRPGPGPSGVIKRSVLIAGHPTSVSLEAAFWDGLKAIATERAVPLTALLSAIDGSRTGENLSSAIRVFVLNRYREPPAT